MHDSLSMAQTTLIGLKVGNSTIELAGPRLEEGKSAGDEVVLEKEI